MDKELHLRFASLADAKTLSIFAACAFEEAFGGDNDPEDLKAHLERSFGVAQQSEEIKNPKVTTLVIESRDGELAAYAQVREGLAPSCVKQKAPIELHRFYVDGAWHGKGVARELMRSAKSAGRDHGGESLWLSVWEHNPRALAFYKKEGFRDAGSKDFLVGSDRQTDRVLVVLL